MKLTGKKVLVVGTKRSGLGAIELLRAQGAHVMAMDEKPLSPEEKLKFEGLGVPVVLQMPENLSFGGAEMDLIVLSPAVPFDLPLFTDIRSRGIPVIGEV